MKFCIKTAFFILQVIFLTGCNIFGTSDRKNGRFLDEVINLSEYNSPFDDYNSDLPANKHGSFSLVFSSNRKAHGLFNLVSFPAWLHYDEKENIPGLSQNQTGGGIPDFSETGQTNYFINGVNGNFNVLGPRFISTYNGSIISYGDSQKFNALFYADDSEGNFKIRYVYQLDKTGEFRGPFSFSLLNDRHNSAYPSFDPYGEKIYFCSDREGNFDIYELSVARSPGERVTIEDLTHPAQYTLRKVEELSSAYDDKCPYLSGNTLVFTSNREGGEGGFDIYYSVLKDGKWSEPVNAGKRINTSYDEYRPILPDLPHFTYHLMIFSSNRPGGKGGFDLYMTGLTDKR